MALDLGTGLRPGLRFSDENQLSLACDETGVDISLARPRLRFHHSFVRGSIPQRARQPRQAILKACNHRQDTPVKVLDLTAGWGVDAFTLACHGRSVTLLECHELLAAILLYSINRIAVSDPLRQRLSVRQGHACDFLQQDEHRKAYDCIYLDPMFPVHKSTAKPGKEMQILQQLTENRELESAFELALESAKHRVIVKRPSKAPVFTGRNPDFEYREKTIRFDVYHTG